MAGRKKATQKKAVKRTVKKTAKRKVHAAPGHKPSGKVRAAINGFGRIGRMTFLASLGAKDVQVVAINDLSDTKTLAHLLKYDSVQGTFPGTVEATEDSLVINGKHIPVYHERDPAALPWLKHRIDVVMECTGRFLTRSTASGHLKAGARKVLLSAPQKSPPSEEPIKTIVLGVNHKTLKKTDVIVSNASCTTNCFAPLAKILNDKFSIRSGYMVTVHAYTSSQKLVDGGHKDLRRARAAAVNIIPTKTGAAKAIGEVIPELDGKLAASAVRVPVPCGSICYFVAEIKEQTTPAKINQLYKKLASGSFESVLRYTDEPIVSSDIIHDPHSCIFDSGITEIEGQGSHTLVTVGAWYDNEWGYSCRMIDVCRLMGK